MTRYLYAALFGLALVAGAFFAGRWTAPAVSPPAEILERVLPITKTIYKDRTSVVTRRVVVETKPDGSSVSTTDETERTEEHTEEKPPPPSELAPLVVAASKATEPKFRLGVSAGLTLDLTSGNVAAKMTYALEFDYRLLGPVWIGARVNTQPFVGAAIGVTW